MIPWDQTSKKHYKEIVKKWNSHGKSHSECIEKMEQFNYQVSKKQLELKDNGAETYIVFENKKNSKHKLIICFWNGKSSGWIFYRKNQEIPESNSSQILGGF